REGDRSDQPLVAGEGPHRLAGSGVPQPHRPVVPDAGDRLAVRTEGEERHLALVPAENLTRPPGAGVPQPDRVFSVDAPHQQQVPLGVECDRADFAAVVAENRAGLTGHAGASFPHQPDDGISMPYPGATATSLARSAGVTGGRSAALAVASWPSSAKNRSS